MARKLLGVLLGGKELEPFLVACGGSAHKPNQHKATTTSDAVMFSQCMRHHGLSKFPDPPALGTVTIGHMSPTGRALSAGINVAAPAFKAALAKCGSIMSNALNG
jgi:hypothetical protein